MRILAINLLLIISTHARSQADLGVGLVSVDFNDSTVLEFYSDTLNNEPIHIIEFFDDRSTNSWNIKDLPKQKKWLKPELLWLDYSTLNFRCRSISYNWLELIVNNDTGRTYWLRKTKAVEFKNWEEYLKGMFGVERLSKHPQKIKESSSDFSQEIEYSGKDCFVVISMEGDWIEIKRPEYCSESEEKFESGWIRWRDKNQLIINYFTTS